MVLGPPEQFTSEHTLQSNLYPSLSLVYLNHRIDSCNCSYINNDIFEGRNIHFRSKYKRNKWYNVLIFQIKLLYVSLMVTEKQKSMVSSVQFSGTVVSDSLWPHGPQYARPPCPSPTPRACSNSCPSSRWCHPTISSSVFPFPSCLQSLPASGSFTVGHFFTSGGQSIGASASASVLPMNTQGWSPLGWTGWISLQSKGLSRVFSNTAVQTHQFCGAQPSSQSNSHIHIWSQEKP